MKFSYRSNKFLELQKVRGSFWVDKLGATEIVNRFQMNALMQGKSYDWHEKSSQLLSDIYQSGKFKNLHFTKTMIEKSRKCVNISKSVKAFQSIEQDFGCVILDNQCSILYGIYKDRFLGVALQGDCVANVELITFNDTEKGYTFSSFFQSVADALRATHPETVTEIEQNQFNIFEELIPLLTIYHFATIENHSIDCNKTRKVVIESEKYINETDISIKIINSTWFTNIVRTTGFAVSGHFRLQPYGKDRKDRKLIWINEFEKQGYTRLAQKDLELS
jgi:hypothetical protein